MRRKTVKKRQQRLEFLLPDRPRSADFHAFLKAQSVLRQVEQRAVFVEDAMNDLQAARNGLWTLSAG